MGDDILTRLRFWSETRNNQPTSWNIDCAVAADEIERLRSTVTDCRIEIEQLRAELRRYTGDHHTIHADMTRIP